MRVNEAIANQCKDRQISVISRVLGIWTKTKSKSDLKVISRVLGPLQPFQPLAHGKRAPTKPLWPTGFVSRLARQNVSFRHFTLFTIILKVVPIYQFSQVYPFYLFAPFTHAHDFSGFTHFGSN